MAERPNPRDLRAALKRADAERAAEPMPPEVERRLRARIEASIDGPAPRPAWVPWVLGLGLATAAAVALVVVTSGPREVGGFRPVDRDVVATVDAAGVVSLPAAAVVSEPLGGRVEALAEARIQGNSKGFRVVSGRVKVDVEKRRAGAEAYEVAVSHGAIRVLGTSFTIDQGATGGTVTLHEGSILFAHADGTEERLVPGQSTSWPRPPPAAPEPVPAPVPAPTPAPAPVPAPSPLPVFVPPPSAPVIPLPVPSAPVEPDLPSPAPVEPVPVPAPAPPEPVTAAEKLRVETLRADAVLAKVAGLRSRGKYEDAVKALDAALGDAYGPTTAERLSYEQLSILAFQLRDAARTCDALRRHLDAFGKGRYADGLDQVRAEHACAAP